MTTLTREQIEKWRNDQVTHALMYEVGLSVNKFRALCDLALQGLQNSAAQIRRKEQVEGCAPMSPPSAPAEPNAEWLTFAPPGKYTVSAAPSSPYLDLIIGQGIMRICHDGRIFHMGREISGDSELMRAFADVVRAYSSSPLLKGGDVKNESLRSNGSPTQATVISEGRDVAQGAANSKHAGTKP